MALPALALIGTGISAAGTVFAGVSSAEQASYQAAVARNNATIAGQNEEYAAESGAVNAENAGLQAGQRLGAIKASQAANNIDVNSGSAADVQKSQRELGEYSQVSAENQALLQAHGYAATATSETAQSELDEATAANAVPGALLSATGTGLSNAALLPAKFAWMNTEATGNAAGNLSASLLT
jgi:hypothetical protein